VFLSVFTAQQYGDTVAGRVWSFRDVTKRKQAEKDLQESERLLREAQVIAGLAIISLISEQGCGKVQRCLTRYLGLTKHTSGRLRVGCR